MREEPRKNRRCAIYTRKSTEEGLDQEFNSLDAQREACRAYVMSQTHEGWSLDETIYDDGGFSGGNMERPALTALMAEVKAGRIDIIIVYKVDRLTRSLADFAKIVDVMDDADASFVSVTQSFNTTTSMGRLTLNVLLSFAQFEREVTSERIRDKIAASKKKGMWMGGPVPLGYRLEDRKLYVEPAEAETVNRIFETYLECGSMAAATEKLEELGIKTKKRTYRTGQSVGGVPLTRGGLQHLLRNAIYRGQIVHKEKIWPGEHEAIIEEALWQKVQDRFDSNDNGGNQGLRAKSPSILGGLVTDEYGRRLVPNHATKGSRRYRYYVTGSEENVTIDRPRMRIPAHDLENAVIERLRQFLTSPAELGQYFDPSHLSFCILQGRSLLTRLGTVDAYMTKTAIGELVDGIVIATDKVQIRLKTETELGDAIADVCLNMRAVRIRTGGETRLVIGDGGGADYVDNKLSLLLAEAFEVREQIVGGQTIAEIAAEKEQTPQWIGKLVRISWLPPELVEQVLDGSKAASVTRRRISQTPFRPVVWTEQMAEVADW